MENTLNYIKSFTLKNIKEKKNPILKIPSNYSSFTLKNNE